MPKNTAKETTNGGTPVSLTVDDALGRGGYVGERSERNRTGVKPEDQLTSHEQILVRTEPGAATAADGKFRRRFNICLDRGKNGSEVAWLDEQWVDTHEANKVAVLQFALNAGLHPQGAAEFEGCIDSVGRTATLVYAVPVLPATEADASQTYAPRKALLEMDGASTFVGDDGNVYDSPPAT